LALGLVQSADGFTTAAGHYHVAGAGPGVRSERFMAFNDLGGFLDLLSDQGHLRRIRVAVDPVHEITAVICRARAEGSQAALVFENVRGSRIPLVTGLFATGPRLLQAAGARSFDELTARVTSVVRPELPTGWLETLELIPRLSEVANWPVRLVETGLCQQVVHPGADVNLALLPAPTGWPGEALPSLTAGLALIEQELSAPVSPDPASQPAATRRRILQRVPVQIRDRNSLLVHWTPHDPAWPVIMQALKAGRPKPVAVILGGDPALTIAASLPAPPYLDGLVLAGFLRRRNCEVVPARSVDLRVPADAEIILEGLIEPHPFQETAPPVALPTGFLSDPVPALIMTVTAVTHRANPILPVIIPENPVALPPGQQSEDGWLAVAAERLLLPLLKLAVPELTGFRRPRSGAFRHLAFASIRKTFPQQARRVMNALWGLGALSTIKLLVVVDDDVELASDEAVWAAVTAQVHPGRDTLFSEGPADMFDHAAPARGIGHRMGLDATRKLPEEGHPRSIPADLRMDAAFEQMIQDRWLQYGLRH